MAGRVAATTLFVILGGPSNGSGHIECEALGFGSCLRAARNYSGITKSRWIRDSARRLGLRPHPFSRKLSITRFSPACSKATVSLLPSTAVTLP